MIERFTLDSLRDLDGGAIRAAIDRDLEAAARDCVQRPMDSTVRTVTVTINLKPAPEQNGTAEHCAVNVESRVKLPKRRSRVVDMRVSATGQLGFNPDSPDNVEQRTIDDAGD